MTGEAGTGSTFAFTLPAAATWAGFAILRRV